MATCLDTGSLKKFKTQELVENKNKNLNKEEANTARNKFFFLKKSKVKTKIALLKMIKGITGAKTAGSNPEAKEIILGKMQKLKAIPRPRKIGEINKRKLTKGPVII